MGKGKKDKGAKGKSEDPVPSLSTLSLTEPSTSCAQEEEEPTGLTSAAARRKAKKAARAAPLEGSKQATAKESTPETVAAPEPPAPAPEPAPAKEEKAVTEKKDDVGLGLGTGDGAKKRPRRKKPSLASQEAAGDALPVQPAAAAALPPSLPAQHAAVAQVAAPPTQESQPLAAAASWGAGRGRGRGGPRPGFPPAQAPAPGGWPGMPATPGWGGAGPTQPGPPRFAPGPPQASTAQQPAPLRQTSPAPLSAGASSTSLHEVSTGKTLCRYKIPPRIEGRSVPARHIKVLTNYLQMKILPLKIHRYDVTFKPDKPKKMISPVFIMVKKKLFPKELIAFDQMKNCYARNPLPNVPQHDRLATTVEITDQNERKMTFEVSFKFTGIVDLQTILTYMQTGGTSLNPPTEAIQCVDVILRQGTLESYIKAGRQFFKRPSRPIDLGDGLEMWTGLFQSAIFTTQPFINVDVAHKGFPKAQPLVEALQKDFRLSTNEKVESQRNRSVESFLSFVKGLKVIAYIGGDRSAKGQKREFIVNGLSDPPNKLTFTIDSGNGRTRSITVAEYFAKEKGIQLRYPNLNCVWVGPKDKHINYPMELLEVAYGQARNRQLNEMQLSTMVKQAATPPDERKRKIEDVIKDMDYSRNSDFKQFGLEISDKFFPVDAKVLAPPRLETGSGPVEPRNGQWQANKLLKAEALRSWGFIVIEPDGRSQCDYPGIISLMMNCGRGMGMEVKEPVVQRFNLQMRDLRRELLQCLDNQVKFLFVIVPTRGRDYYHKVKKLAECDVGILTQCIKEQTAARRMNPQTARNILLKVNSKLMGINQALDVRSMPNCLRDGKVMVVGADVTHPSPDQKEMIVEFEDMMVDHLSVYKQRNGFLPTKIYVFRDGVSEGQFAQVMNSELAAVHKAYQKLAGANAKPEVLFLLVQKRHHTRLFLGDNNPKNVEPGTVVDKHIVHATELDFYLVSHQAIKGTARPTRYHAVCNDGGLKHDEVEQLTYYLCHLYSRCMRSVSYPTPTYYAHLACLRARSLTYEERFDNASLEKKPRRLRVLDKMLSYSRMFFV